MVSSSSTPSQPGAASESAPADDHNLYPGAPPEIAALELPHLQAEASNDPTRPGAGGGRGSGSVPGWFYAFLPNKVGLGATINLPPLFLTEVLGGNVASVGIASALTSAAPVPAATAWGWLSDRYATRKLYLLLGFVGFAIPTLLTAWTTAVWQYMVLAVLMGAWSVAGTPVSSTLVMDTVPRSEWDETFGRLNAIMGWGVVAGRLVGLLTIWYGINAFGNEQTQRGLWLISGGLSLFSVLWAWRTVPQPRMPKPRPARAYAAEVAHHTGFTIVERVRFLPQSLYHLPIWQPRVFFASTLPRSLRQATRQTRDLLANPLVAYYLASFVLFTVSVMAYTPFAVWQRQELGNPSATVFLVGMVNSVASALTFRWVGRQIKLHGSIRVQMATISVRAITFGGFAVIGWMNITGAMSLFLLILLNALSGLGWAGIAVAGNTTVAHLAPKGSEGAAVGTYTSFVSVGSILGAFVSGFLVLRFSYEIVFLAGGIGVLCAVALLALIRRSAPASAREHL
ncbi:MAG: MFS transporter [Caldilineaceae bacterium]